MVRHPFLFVVLPLCLISAANRAGAESAEIADRFGLESVWKRSGRTTRVIDYPYSPQPGQYGGADVREWGNRGYIFINPKIREYERVIPPLEKEIAPTAVEPTDEELLEELLAEEEKARRLEEEKKEMEKKLEELRVQLEDEIIKRKQLELQFQEMEQTGAGAVPGEGTGYALSEGMVAEKVDTYLVQPEENLWGIAGRPEIYGDPYKWLLLYHANRDQIFDPDLIYPGMILLVPRYRGLNLAPAEPPADEEKILLPEE